jgi:hypothetical protein
MGYGIKGRNRMLRSVSEKRQSVRDKPPEAREGTDGSKTIGKLSKGLFQFVKIGPKWFSSRFNEKPLTLKEEINETIPNISFRDHKTDLYGDLVVKGKAPEITIVADGTEDSGIQFNIDQNGAKADNWQLGIDYSQQTGSDNKPSFRLDNSFSPGSSPVMEWDTDGNVHLYNPSQSAAAAFRFYDDNLTHYTGLKAHGTTTGSVDYILPAAKPASDKILQSDSSGNLTWVTQGSGADGMGAGFYLEDGDGTEVNIGTSKEVKFVEGAGIDIDWTDTDNGTDGDPYDLTFTIDHDAANNFVANEHIDWTASSAGTIHATNYTNTTYSEATGSAEGLMSIAHHDKLDGIETGATADQTKSDIDGLGITTVGTVDTGTWQGTAIASAYLDSDTAHLSGTQTFSGDKQFTGSNEFLTSANSLNLEGGTVTTAGDHSQLVIKTALNASGSDADHYYAGLELRIVDTQVGQYAAAGVNYIFCHNESITGAGGKSRTPHFRVALDGSIYSTGVLSASGAGTSSVGGDLTVGDDLTVSGNHITCNGYKHSGGTELISFGNSNVVVHKGEYQRYSAGSNDVKFEIFDVDGDDNTTFLTIDCNDDGSTVAGTCAFSKPITNTSTISSSNGVCGGPNTWSFSTGGYARMANTTSYYMTSYRGDETWANTRSNYLSSSNLSYLDLPGAEWIAPAAGTVTRLQISYRQTGATDNITFYIYKVSLSDNVSGLSITEIANQSIAVGSTSKQYFESLAISSSNTIAQNDGIYVMVKKDGNTATTYSYFNVTVSGEYS